MTVGFFRFSAGLLIAEATAFSATLTGIVTDPIGRPSAQALVTLLNKQTGQSSPTIADQRGRYEFHGLEVGSYYVSAEQGELQTGPLSVEFSSSSDERVESLALALERVRAEVVVTATVAPESADAVSRAVDIVRQADWQARGVSTLSEAVQQTPGLRVQSLGGPGGFTRILLRGLPAQDSAISIDGLRFRDPATTQGDASSFLEAIMLTDSDRVEVLRGSGSALYGTNAVGGVINVVTQSGSDRWHGSLMGEGGGLAYGLGRVQASGPLSKALSFTGGLQYSDVSRGVDGQDPFRNTSLQTALFWKPTPGILVTGRFFGGNGFAGVNDSPFAAPANLLPPHGVIHAIPVTPDEQHLIEAGQPIAFVNGANFIPNLNDPDQHRASRFAASALMLNHHLTRRLSYKVSYQDLITRRRFDDGPAGVRLEPSFRTEDRYRGQADTVQARADYWISPNWHAGGGYEFERENYRSQSTNAAPIPLFFSATAGQHSHAMFAYLEANAFSHRLHFSIAGRQQLFALLAPIFRGGISPYLTTLLKPPPTARTFDAGTSWFVARTGTKLRAHAGNGYRAPSMFERFGMSSVNGLFAPNGNPELRPDRTMSLDAGVDQYLWKEHIRVSATSFYTDLREVIAFDASGFLNPMTDPFGRTNGYINTAGGIARGTETEVEAALPRGTRWVTSYTYTNASQRRSTVADGDYFKSPMMVSQQFTSTLTMPVTKRIDVSASAWITGPHVAILSRRAFSFDGARRLDVAASYRVPWEVVALQLQVRVSNILDSQYLENGFRTPGRWATAGFKFSF